MRRVVYTALMGNYERQVAKAVPANDGVVYLCFSDNPRIAMPGWETIAVNPLFPMDSVRSARALKIRGHEALSEFDESLWLDNRIELLVPPDDIFNLLLPQGLDTSFGAPLHSFRSTVEDEFLAVLRHGYDDPRRVREQYAHYRSFDPNSLMQVPIWTAVMARKNTPEVSTFNAIWADHVNRYSRRDQLSVRQALSDSKLKEYCPPINNVHSQYHRWLDESSMERRSDISRWSGGSAASGSYKASDWMEDSYHRARRKLATVRLPFRVDRN